jgi:hypothetical protein
VKQTIHVQRKRKTAIKGRIGTDGEAFLMALNHDADCFQDV